MLKKTKSLYEFLPKMIAFRKDFDKTKYVSFLIKDDELSEKYNEIWDKVSHTVGKEYDNNPVYNKKYLRAKIKSYNGKININFHNNRIPKEDSQLICLSVILIDSVFRAGKHYFPQIFLQECK